MTSWEERVPSSDMHEIPLGWGCGSRVSTCFSHFCEVLWETAEIGASNLLGWWTCHTEDRLSWLSSQVGNMACVCTFSRSRRNPRSPHHHCLSSAFCTGSSLHCQLLWSQHRDWSLDWLSNYEVLSKLKPYILSNARFCVPLSFFFEFLTPAEAKT